MSSSKDGEPNDKLPQYPDALDSTPRDFAKYVFDSVDCKVMAQVLKKGPLRIGSFCTGMGTCYIVFKALMCVWNETKAVEFGAEWANLHTFAIENDKDKRELIAKNMAVQRVFENVEDVAEGRAYDFKAETIVDTFAMDVDIVLAGRLYVIRMLVSLVDIQKRIPLKMTGPLSPQLFSNGVVRVPSAAHIIQNNSGCKLWYSLFTGRGTLLNISGFV